MSSYEDIRILTHIIGCFGKTAFLLAIAIVLTKLLLAQVSQRCFHLADIGTGKAAVREVATILP
ncbi:hypothetical protein LC607_18525 [Nostoc sp. CHAB 5824]|nr:hypothetical protein [Nostoc sp. CHAB 5824]